MPSEMAYQMTNCFILTEISLDNLKKTRIVNTYSATAVIIKAISFGVEYHSIIMNSEYIGFNTANITNINLNVVFKVPTDTDELEFIIEHKLPY